ncbi:sugar O-acetyltransferase [Trueperella sp. LYQ143]|uniref:sugar O-acetyltransferase n=1 Tax=unclassified Trueperella TaxID=2630174 RepID=UPI003982F86E
MAYHPVDIADVFRDDPRSQRERMLAGDMYIADDPELARMHRRALELSERFAAEFPADPQAAQRVVRQLLGSCGEDVYIRAPIWVDYGVNIHIGARTFINCNLTALDVGRIEIGCDCQIGPQCQLVTPTHPIDPDMRSAKLEAAQPIVVEDNVWLGAGVIVCPGVRIGENSVIGAGSVVVRDIPANVVAVGNPARVIRVISPQADG